LSQFANTSIKHINQDVKDLTSIVLGSRSWAFGVLGPWGVYFGMGSKGSRNGYGDYGHYY
jgi:hypothetical protein